MNVVDISSVSNATRNFILAKLARRSLDIFKNNLYLGAVVDAFLFCHPSVTDVHVLAN